MTRILKFILFFGGTALLGWFFCVPLIGFSILFGVRVTLIVLGAVAVLSTSLLLLLSEWGVYRRLQGQLPRSYGLRNSYELAAIESGVILKTRPALVTVPDPIPNVFVVRALGGDGVILVSEGLISILDESELRFVLTRSIQRLFSPEIVLQSAAIFVLTMIQHQFATGARGLSPGQALRKLFWYPWLRFYSSLARGGVTGRVENSLDHEFKHGASKLARAEQLYGQQAFLPGLVYLGIER